MRTLQLNPNGALSRPLIVAHRGASREAPENTLPAFRLAWAQGADAIEGDFRLTRDGEVVCFHDADTGRMAGVRRVVREATLAELKALEVSQGGAETRVPTLREVLATVPPGKRLFAELKTGPEILAPFLGAVEASGLAEDQLVVIAFDAAVLAELHRRAPTIPLYWLVDLAASPTRPSADQFLPTLERCGASGLSSSPHPSLDRAFVERLAAGGFSYHAWTIDEVALAHRLLALGAASLTTNRPGALRRELDNAALAD